MSETVTNNLDNLLSNLRIPTDFARSTASVDIDLGSLQQWKDKVSTVLEEVRSLAQGVENMGDQDKGDLIYAVAPFGLGFKAEERFDVAEWEPWRTEETNRIAEEILNLPALTSPPKTLVSQILVQHLKPVFRSSTHPHINPATGRKVSSIPGDPLVMQDYFEAQKWKGELGIDKVVLWCLRSIQTDWYEGLWHLLIPPIMAFMDDYDVNYKLRGVLLVQQLLAHVPKDLLKKTGIDGLLRTSLRSGLAHLENPMSPDLIRYSVSTSVTLIVDTSSVGTESHPSSQRFDELSSLLGEGIIAGIWMYAEDKPKVVLATFDTIPVVLRALGVGSARFLQALIPQLTHALKPRPLVDPDREMQKSALIVLSTTIDVSPARISYWSETILDAIGRCWVALTDDERGRLNESLPQDATEVKHLLKQVCRKLEDTYPPVKDLFKRFLDADSSLFHDLFPSASTPPAKP